MSEKANCANEFPFDAGLIEAEEDLVIDAQFLIQELLREHGMTRAELARRTGISKARLSQMMRPEANPTLRSLARLFYAMGDRATLSRKDKIAATYENKMKWVVQEAQGKKLEARPALLKALYDSSNQRGYPRACIASNDDDPRNWNSYVEPAAA